ncbi:MAG: 4Fe-4S dicluster domain-containing protein, partial [Candidatus Aminicenantes bacterium]|nr:4Fe-4S dicluster domain-containing protein [Candidatus Aminicenantes bacterium]
YSAREQVAPLRAAPPRRLVAGVKACDLRALALLDRALINNDFADPAYSAWRSNVVVLGADCTDLAATCHCSLMGGEPYAEAGFDVNVSRAGDEYALAAGTPQGEQFVDLVRKNCRTRAMDDAARALVSGQRAGIRRRLDAQNKDFAPVADYAELRTSSPAVWKGEARECVGCGACTNICPTCYCLILNDETETGAFVKVRSHDSCQWHGYAREASGASPRPYMSDRFRNRYLCKFIYLNRQFGRLGCTGCGRCTEACPGEIDLRRVLARALQEPPVVSSACGRDSGGR